MKNAREERTMTASECVEKERVGIASPLGFSSPVFDVHSMLMNMFGDNTSRMFIDSKYIPERILKSGTATIVFWKDCTKTIVKLPEGDTPDDYSAFTAALAKKIFGSNNKVKKVIRIKTEIQKPKEGKEDEVVSIPDISPRADEE